MSEDGEKRKMSPHSLEMIEGEVRQRKSSLKSSKSLLYQPTRTHRLSVNFDPDPIVLPISDGHSNESIPYSRESSLNDEKNEDVNGCKTSSDTSSQDEALNDEKNEDVNGCKTSSDTSSQDEDEVDLATIEDLNKKFSGVKIDGRVKIGKPQNKNS